MPRSSEPTASTMVCWGASLSMTATSPNWRSASTRATGRLLFLARRTATLQAITDLPAPPLVEKTVMTWPSPPGSGAPWTLFGSMIAGCCEPLPSMSPTRLTVMASWERSWSGSTSRTPARRACWRTSVVSCSAMRMAPISGRGRVRRSTTTNWSGEAIDGPRTTTRGVPVSLVARASIDGKGTAWVPSCMASWVRTISSTSTVASGRWLRSGAEDRGSRPMVPLLPPKASPPG